MPKPKVGVALGSGAARGLANLGFLQALHEAEIPIDYIAGTSAGAVVGALYASGSDLNLLANLVSELNWSDLTGWTLQRRGLVSSEKMHTMLQVLTKGCYFSELAIPTAVVATDLRSGEEVVIQEGLVADGVRASLSIPGVFVPLEQNEQVLVDGALVNRVPSAICRQMGADFVIACDVGFAPLRGKIRNLPDIILQTIDILSRQVATHAPCEADILIAPDLGNITLTQLNRADEIIKKGYEATRKEIDRIKRKLELG